MIEFAIPVLLIVAVLLLLSGSTQKKRSPTPPINPSILESEDYKFDAIAEITYKLSDDTKRRLIKHLARQLKRSKLSKVKL